MRVTTAVRPASRRHQGAEQRQRCQQFAPCETCGAPIGIPLAVTLGHVNLPQSASAETNVTKIAYFRDKYTPDARVPMRQSRVGSHPLRSAAVRGLLRGSGNEVATIISTQHPIMTPTVARPPPSATASIEIAAPPIWLINPSQAEACPAMRENGRITTCACAMHKAEPEIERAMRDQQRQGLRPAVGSA